MPFSFYGIVIDAQSKLFSSKLFFNKKILYTFCFQEARRKVATSTPRRDPQVKHSIIINCITLCILHLPVYYNVLYLRLDY